MKQQCIVSLACLYAVSAYAQATYPNIFTCGNSTVTESRLQRVEGKDTLQPMWKWTAATSQGMPEALAAKFSTIDECKPSGRPEELLVTSSHDAFAIVSRKDGSTFFSAEVKNAHSAALLSDGLVAVASSDAKDGTGDRVVFFNRRVPGRPVAELPVAAAHGLVWVSKEHALWVLGLNQLLHVSVTLSPSATPLVRVLDTYRLPETTGHDLRMSLSCDALLLSTTHQVWKFDLHDKQFSVFAPLANLVDVKSFSLDPSSGRMAYTRADPGGYWTTTLRFTHPSEKIDLPESIYKTRWTTDVPVACSIE